MRNLLNQYFPTFYRAAVTIPSVIRQSPAVAKHIGFYIWRTVLRVLAIKLVRKPLKALVYTVAFLFVVYALLSLVWGRGLKHDLDQLRADWEPIDSYDRLLAADISDQDNAAIVYRYALTVVKSRPLPPINQSGPIPPSGFFRPATPGAKIRQQANVALLDQHGLPESFDVIVDDKLWRENGHEIKKAILRNRYLFSLISEAASKPGCCFSKGYYEDYVPNLECSGVRSLVRWVTCKSAVEARDGNIDAAIDDIVTAFKIARTSVKVPSLIAYSARGVNINHITYGIQTIANREELSIEQAVRIYNELEEIHPAKELTHVLKGERVAANMIFNETRDNSPEAFLFYHVANPALVSHIPGIVTRRPGRLLSFRDQRLMLNIFEKGIKSVDLPYRELLKQSPPDKSVETFLNYSTGEFNICSPVVWQVKDRLEVDKGLAQTAMALAIYKNRYNAYPRSLNEVTNKMRWALPKDPFSGHLFIYRPSGHGYILYSYGPDLKDDSGKPYDKSGHSYTKDTDIVWRCVR